MSVLFLIWNTLNCLFSGHRRDIVEQNKRRNFLTHQDEQFLKFGFLISVARVRFLMDPMFFAEHGKYG